MSELKHYGILGMKWGVRRYQNPDGTYTDAGKKRYGGSDGENRVKKANNMSEVERKWAQGREEDTDRTKDYNPRAVTTTKHKRLKMTKEMSDEELNERIKRLEKEARYLQLEQNLDSLDPLAGKSAVTRAMSAVGNKVIIPALSAGAGSFLAFLLTKTALSDATVDFVKKAIEKGVLGKK